MAVNDTKPKSEPSAAPKKKGGQRAKYERIHALPLPLQVHPLPAFIPQNPLSILRIFYVYLYQRLSRQSSHPKDLPKAYSSQETSSLHVTDAGAMRQLWEQGFFGKGSLSRSEPSWLDREQKRLGLVAAETSEEVTKKRRKERRDFKNERARLEQEAIEKQRQAERAQQLQGREANGSAEDSLVTEPVDEESPEIPTPELASNPAANGDLKSVSGAVDTKSAHQETKSTASPRNPATVEEDDAHPSPPAKEITNQEHLQLSPEEAFFLFYGLGAIEVLDAHTNEKLTPQSLFTLLRRHSYFPPKPTTSLRPDDPFLLSYVVYHHFRSLGWVVRAGVKFAVDFLLYNRGPVFSHAEFAVIIMPSYSDAYWHEAERVAETRKREGRTWHWLHMVNRVQSQVRKTLVLVYVDVPPPDQGLEEAVNIGGMLERYQVREFMLKRWQVNRSRA